MTYDNSYLDGLKFRGNTFRQDTKTNWIKIDNVSLGESPENGYISIENNDVGNLLDLLGDDEKAQVVIYDWEKKIAYVKSGFNLSIIKDSDEKNGLTTFVKKINTLPSPLPSLVNQNSKVSWDGSRFIENGKRFIPVGFNAYWMGLHESYTYPQINEIEQMFVVARKMAATVIRAHTLAVSSGNNMSLWNNGKINTNAWGPIEYVLYYANRYNIKLIIPLTDSYNYYHGNYGDFCKARGVDKKVFFTNQAIRQDFKQYISMFLNHTNKLNGIKIKDDPSILFIELGNELGNYRPNSSSILSPTKDWVSEISKYIKSITNTMVLDCCDESSGKIGNLEVDTLDCYRGHFYSADYNRMDQIANAAASKKKPYIISEYSSNFRSDFFKAIESRPNVKGSMFWSLYPNQGGSLTGKPLIHSDGFTLNWVEKNMNQLLFLSNHMRRMQNLPEVSGL